jgi:hypothetical protein
MQNIDNQILNRLIDHFEEMDFDGTRMLVIGLHIPSKQQAEEMKLEIKNTNMTLKEAWEIKKKKLMQDLGYNENNKLASRVSLRKAAVAEANSTSSPSKTPKPTNKELEMMTSATTDDATAKQKNKSSYDIDSLPVDNSAMKTLKKKSVTTLKSAKAEHIGVSI